MDYTITSMKDYAENMEIGLNKNGNKYYISIIKKNDLNSNEYYYSIENEYYSQHYDSIDEATEIYCKFAEWIAKGMYSFENRIKFLKGEQI